MSTVAPNSRNVAGVPVEPTSSKAASPVLPFRRTKSASFLDSCQSGVAAPTPLQTRSLDLHRLTASRDLPLADPLPSQKGNTHSPSTLPPRYPTSVKLSTTHVRRLGNLIQENDEEDRRVWSITWKGLEMVVKGGETVRTKEAELTDLARNLTGLPVPVVYGVKQDGSATYLYFEKLVGTPFHQINSYRLPKQTEQALRHELKTVFDRLRATTPPPGYPIRLGSGDPQPLSAIFGSREVRAPSPLFSAKELHDFLRDRVDTLAPSHARTYARKVESRLRRFEDLPLVFVHGDLNPTNILIHNGRVSGVIDWDRAGWYPAWVEDYELTVLTRQVGADEGNRVLAEVATGGKRVLRSDGIIIRGTEWLLAAREAWRPQKTT
ncbi:hypothetical protein JCM10207_004807 [Rhodosporidiobolus poonsookiae]